MNQNIKLVLYVGLLLGSIIFGVLFYSSYKRLNAPSDYQPANLATEPTNLVEQANNTATNTNEAPATDAAATNSAAPQNTTGSTRIAETNAADESTSVVTARTPTTGRSEMIGYMAAFIGTAILLGLLIGRDVSEYFGNRTIDFLMNDEGTGIKNPEYDEAEREWANGHHLDAIRMMRDYLVKNPREQYVALRIAEIYEKDLKNYLAATLEYEEILKHKLPPQRWGWAAIHLCNLYSKLNKPDDAVALLHRIVKEYGETPAAEKARQRLATFETVGEEALGGELPDSIRSASLKPASKSKPEPESNLPPGFRPKK